MTSDATSITLTGGSTITSLTTGKIIASTGTREGGLAWTGIIAMNTLSQEIFYTDNSKNVNFNNNVVIDGICAPASLLCTNDATIGGAINVSGTAASVSIQSTQPNNYVHLALNTTSGSPAIAESAKICCGGDAGLNICTTSAHLIVLRTAVDEPGAPTSMQILATGTRDVEIIAPLKVKSFLSTFENGMSV